MKIAYISYLPIADVDFSYLHEAQMIMVITCYMFVNPHHIKRSVVNFHTLLDKSGVYDASEFPELMCYRDYLDLSKIKVINIADTKHWQVEAFKILKTLCKLFDKEYDIIHLTRLPQWFEIPFFSLRRKAVLSVHDPIPHSGQSLKSRILTNSARWVTYRLLHNFIIFNKAQKEEFVKTFKLQKKNVIVSKLSCYTCLQPIEDKLNKLPDSKFILFSGRITQYKGLQYLLPAFRRVHKHHPDVKLIVAGSGNFPFDVEEYKQLDYIEFRHRFIPDTELIQLMKSCMFMVCPYTDATQSGVIMSAFAFNVPVLATNVGGLPEMVKDGVFGRIIKEKDEGAIADGICEMLSDSEFLKLYSNNIKQEYSDGELAWKTIAARLKNDYNSCV